MCPAEERGNITVVDELITHYHFELVPDHHSPGSGRYGLRIVPTVDISASFPYLNSTLDGTWYDHENHILVSKGKSQGYAFRPFEILVAALPDPSNASAVACEVVDMVNRVWGGRDRIAPSLRQRKLPAVYDIFKLLPRTNCKQCGYPTCLAYATDLRSGKATIEQCAPLSEAGHAANRERIEGLFPADGD